MLDRKLTQEERLWIVSTVPLVPILILVIIYPIRIVSASFGEAFKYVIIAGILYLFAAFGIYEAVSGLKIKHPLSFKIRRWWARTAFWGASLLLLYVVWSLLDALLSSVLRVQYILILSGLAWEFTLIALLQDHRVRQLIRRWTQEERRAQT